MATRLRRYPALHESVQAEVVAAPDMWIIDFESMLTRLPTLPAPQAESVPVTERTPAASVLSAPAVAAPERETGKKLGHAVPWSDMPAQRFSAKEAAPAKAVPFAPATDPDEDGAADAGTPTTGERAPVDLTGAVDPRRGDSPWQI
ncbi:MAG: hypothetical protein K2Q25_08155 [Mycobacteriaceae bacterium]|nr:hypothetical protein [Mycobacteriaceae bacterium]